ncbi:MAG: hypothetical protein EBV28_08880, partial [Betaproteobacteria bacterium]|nr:hypothetical protein [Betaproteobacteria bacterium]
MTLAPARIADQPLLQKRARGRGPLKGGVVAAALCWAFGSMGVSAQQPTGLPSVLPSALAGSQQVAQAAGPAGATASGPATATAEGRQSAVWRTAEQQQAAFLGTLKSLVEIESGSRDLEGLRTLADEVAARMKALGMDVKTIPTKAPDFHPMLKGAELGPMVYGRKLGKGSKKVLLIAHMDTVYPRGMGAKQPFR